mmetsp:Transcript_20555/g.43065  ORF Transcript_20555/g.43065 Transcript_20555/m.43065 type:complete len:99 (+) Transcript_20555:396-692(+)
MYTWISYSNQPCWFSFRSFTSSELIRLECWKAQQKRLPTAEDTMKLYEQNEMLRKYGNTEIRHMPEKSEENIQSPLTPAHHNHNHRKLSIMTPTPSTV